MIITAKIVALSFSNPFPFIKIINLLINIVGDGRTCVTNIHKAWNFCILWPDVTAESKEIYTKTCRLVAFLNPLKNIPKNQVHKLTSYNGAYCQIIIAYRSGGTNHRHNHLSLVLGSLPYSLSGSSDSLVR